MDYTAIYTLLETARVEILHRQRDHDLRRRVEQYLGGIIPEMGKEPVAFLARTVVTPNHETTLFLNKAALLGLKPLGGGYCEDRFLALNYNKRSLLRMSFAPPPALNCNIRKLTIASLTEHEKKPFKQITTLWGEGLVNFHHRLLAHYMPTLNVIDESLWLRSNGTSPKEYYCRHLARFIVHGIMVESYLGNGTESTFVRNIVLPAFKKVTKDLGIKPLIVRLLPEESENSPMWNCYCSVVEYKVAKILSEYHNGQ